jgi:hypothetical protein
MRKLDLQYVVAGVTMDIKGGTYKHLQLAYQEALDALVRGNVNDATQPIIIYGCKDTDVDPFYLDLSAGAIYYNGEIFLVDAQGVSRTAMQRFNASIATTYYTATDADPVIFSNSTTHNVHQIRKIVFTAGSIGGGLFQFEDLQPFTRKQWVDEILTNADLKASAGETLTIGAATSKEIVYYIDEIEKTCSLSFNIVNGNTSASNIAGFYIKIPEGKTCGRVFKGTGEFRNTNTTTAISGTTKWTQALLNTNSSVYFTNPGDAIEVTAAALNFWCDGSNGQNVIGSITFAID